jgi:hypothetical protein
MDLVPPLSLKWKKLITFAAALVAGAALLLWVKPQRFLPSRYKPDPALNAQFGAMADDYRKIIVLMDGADSLDEPFRARCLSAGRQIFWRKTRAIAQLNQRLAGSRNESAVRQLLDYLNGNALHDADKLAFLDVVEGLDATLRRRSKSRCSDPSAQLACRND